MNILLRRSLALGGMEALMRIPLVLATGFLARRLGSADYGQWAVVLAFCGVVFSFASLGLATAVSRYAAGTTSQDALGMLLFALASCVAALVVLAIPILGFKSALASVLGLPVDAAALIAGGLLLVLAQIAESLLDAYFKARELVVRQAFFQLLRTAVDVVAIVAVFNRTSPDASAQHIPALVTYVAIAAAAKTLLYPLLLLGTGHRGGIPAVATRTNMLHLGVPLIPAAILLAVIYQEDRLILGHFVEPSVLGVYALAAALAMYLHSVGTLAYAMLLPRLSRFYDRGSQGELGKLIDLSQRLFLDLMGPVLVCLALLGQEIAVLLAGPSYAPAGPLLLVLGIGVAIDRLLGPYEQVFYLVRRSYWVSGINALSCLTVAIGVVVGVRFAGVLGAACGIVVSTVGINLLRAYASRRFVHVAPSPALWRAILLTVVAVALAAVVASRLDLAGRLLLAVLAAAYAARAVIKTLFGAGEPLHEAV